MVDLEKGTNVADLGLRLDLFAYKEGDRCLTRGGWEAKVIYVGPGEAWAICVHKPGQLREEVVRHRSDGMAMAFFEVGPPPVYDVGHPADIVGLMDKGS